MQHEIRTFQFKLETRADDDDSPVIRGHAAVFDSLSENLGEFKEIIKRGAFLDAIETDDVRALFNHDSNFVLGRNTAGTLRMSEDDTGLAVEIDPPDTTWARDLLTSMRRDDITQMSFAFTVKPDGENWGEQDGEYIRTITAVNLYDVSPVTYPAYPATDVGVRSLQAFIESQGYPVEQALRRIALAQL